MRSAPLSPLTREKPESHRVFMRWVVVTDTKGNRQPQMHWLAN
jgi:hypothetical protein